MDMETLMAQAQSLQEKISEAQDNLAKMHVKGISQNGAVVVDMTGKYDPESVVISENAMQLGAKALSELTLAAIKDAKEKADALIEKVMNSVTGGTEE